jgi:hypothetical protein
MNIECHHIFPTGIQAVASDSQEKGAPSFAQRRMGSTNLDPPTPTPQLRPQTHPQISPPQGNNSDLARRSPEHQEQQGNDMQKQTVGKRRNGKIQSGKRKKSNGNHPEALFDSTISI